MTGFHRMRVYTLDDNDLCPQCANGERITGESTFKDGGVICHAGQIPTSEGCEGFKPRVNPTPISTK